MTTNHTANQPQLPHYDAVVVGARAAGAATAMLLAERGLRVLAVDQQSYGSDTLSTHALMRGAVERLANWGLLRQICESDTPVITSTVLQYNEESVSIDVRPSFGVPGLVAPRRTVLDPALVDAAQNRGAEVLHDTRVQELLVNPSGRVVGVDLVLGGRTSVEVGADLVIGADGLRSKVARAVDAPTTHRGQHASAYTMQYYRDLDVDRDAFQWLHRSSVAGGIVPTSNGETCVFTAMPQMVFQTEGRNDIPATHRHNLELLDSRLAAAVDRATTAGPARSFPGVPGQFRKAFGPGWALVGDAGYFKDPFAAHGITDAFRDAEILTEAIVKNDLPGYETRRDELSRPLFDVLDRIASFGWNLEELKTLHFRLSKAMKAGDAATIRPYRPALAA